MDASLGALVVAVVGVAGTLLSGHLAQRGALRAKRVELEHTAAERREAQRETERRELLESRRATYAEFNQALRAYHAEVSRWSCTPEFPDTEPPPAVENARDRVRAVYAETQMIASDEVIESGGGVFHQLNTMQRERAEHDEQGFRLLLDRASARLYEARQTMRRDLGVTDLPIERPEGYGRL